MKKRINKSGVSAVVATVLIIMITIAAIGIIWVAVLPMIREGFDSSCNDVDVSIGTSQGYTCIIPNQNITMVQLKKGQNDVNVSKITVTLSSKGNSISYTNSTVLVKNSYSLIYLNTTGFNEVDSIAVVPFVKIGRNEKACSSILIQKLNSCGSASFSASEINQIINSGQVLSVGDNSNVVGGNPKSSAKQITVFNFTSPASVGTIYEGNHTIYFTLPVGSSKTSLTPVISIPASASVSPSSGTAKDFTNPVNYTVTAEDGSQQNYTVYVYVTSFLATGGMMSTILDGAINYTIHTFTSNGTFNVTSGSCNTEILVVAGGGAGGNDAGGGGGAGGLIYQAEYAVSPQTYTVVVGAGGTGGPQYTLTYPGSNSSFANLVAIGGGRGAYYNGHSATSGGSGGGGPSCCFSASAGSGTSGQGHDGSITSGGGGAGKAGNGCVGGEGLYFEQFASVGGSPEGWFAGGGSGGCSDLTVNGGGGRGSNWKSNVNLTTCSGKPNTGGGGGGGGGGGPGAYGCAGGSGIVIVRYKTNCA